MIEEAPGFGQVGLRWRGGPHWPVLKERLPCSSYQIVGRQSRTLAPRSEVQSHVNFEIHKSSGMACGSIVPGFET